MCSLERETRRDDAYVQVEYANVIELSKLSI